MMIGRNSSALGDDFIFPHSLIDILWTCISDEEKLEACGITDRRGWTQSYISDDNFKKSERNKRRFGEIKNGVFLE